MARFARIVLAATVLGSASLTACGDDKTGVDAGAYDAGSCGCVRPQDCASGVCCVELSGPGPTLVARTYCVASEVDCPYSSRAPTGKTIACTKDADCATEVPDGGPLQYPGCVHYSVVPCSPYVCMLTGSG
jgi:hypothetical protein